jgi:hypothetical protein
LQPEEGEIFSIVSVVDLCKFKSNVFLIDAKCTGVDVTLLVRTSKSQESSGWVNMITAALERGKKRSD